MTSAASAQHIPAKALPTVVGCGSEGLGTDGDAELLLARFEAGELVRLVGQHLQKQMEALRVENCMLKERLRGAPAAVSMKSASPDFFSKDFGRSFVDVMPSVPPKGKQGQTIEDNALDQSGGPSADAASMTPKAVRKLVVSTHGHLSRAIHSHDDHHPTAKPKTPDEQRRLFEDPEELKMKARRQILNPYDVTELYHGDSIFKQVVTSQWFEGIATVVILVNALWIAIDADTNEKKPLSEKPWIFLVAEVAFYAYFAVELLLRFAAFSNKLDVVKDGWFVFDFILVVLSSIDLLTSVIISNGGSGSRTSVLRLVRLVKLAKMARMARLLKKFPELTILIKGMHIAARSVLSTCVLLVLIVYVFALAFRQLSFESEWGEEYFSSVPHGMMTLVVSAAFPDAADMINDVTAESFILGLFLVFYFILSSLMLLNMLIGVLCEVIGVVSEVEKEQMKVHFVKTQLSVALAESSLHIDKHSVISKSDFIELLMNPAAAKAIRSAGADPVGLVDFCDYIFSGKFRNLKEDCLSFDQLCELILELGGTNGATVKDIVDARKIMVEKFESLDESLEQHLSRISSDFLRIMASTQQNMNANSADVHALQEVHPPIQEAKQEVKLTQNHNERRFNNTGCFTGASQSTYSACRRFLDYDLV
jgi:hypothetical protein